MTIEKKAGTAYAKNAIIDKNAVNFIFTKVQIAFQQISLAGLAVILLCA